MSESVGPDGRLDLDSVRQRQEVSAGDRACEDTVACLMSLFELHFGDKTLSSTPHAKNNTRYAKDNVFKSG